MKSAQCPEVEMYMWLWQENVKGCPTGNALSSEAIHETGLR